MGLLLVLFYHKKVHLYLFSVSQWILSRISIFPSCFGVECRIRMFNLRNRYWKIGERWSYCCIETTENICWDDFNVDLHWSNWSLWINRCSPFTRKLMISPSSQISLISHSYPYWIIRIDNHSKGNFHFNMFSIYSTIHTIELPFFPILYYLWMKTYVIMIEIIFYTFLALSLCSSHLLMIFDTSRSYIKSSYKCDWNCVNSLKSYLSISAIIFNFRIGSGLDVILLKILILFVNKEKGRL